MNIETDACIIYPYISCLKYALNMFVQSAYKSRKLNIAFSCRNPPPHTSRFLSII